MMSGSQCSKLRRLVGRRVVTWGEKFTLSLHAFVFFQQGTFFQQGMWAAGLGLLRKQ
jgi:hypothetical protein